MNSTDLAPQRHTPSHPHATAGSQPPHTPTEYLSLHQAGALIDERYRNETRWRAEHLALTATQRRLDVRLRYTTTQTAQDLATANSEAWHGVWGDHSDRWSPDRRAWEVAYAMDATSRDEERNTYLSGSATHSHHLTSSQTAGAERDGARIGRLPTAATPGICAADQPRPRAIGLSAAQHASAPQDRGRSARNRESTQPARNRT